jgi:medium-chain acyl-[acyl-carrier-protein] hydrolase
MKNRWLVCHRPKPSARLRLVCFPHAGGTASSYRRWSTTLPDDVEVDAVELPGRGTRFTEPLRTSVADVVQELVDALRPWLDRPFAFFGHSMGALLAFEVARALRRQNGPLPNRLCVSAAPAPDGFRRQLALARLSDDQLKEKLRALNGTPGAVLQEDELMGFMLPILRADLSLIDSHEYREEPPFAFPISAFGGIADREVRVEKLEGWRRQTTQAFSLRLFPGDHFFVHQRPERVLPAIVEAVRGTSPPDRPRAWAPSFA